MDYYKIFTIISPLMSALLASGLVYYFNIQGKRFDILYQSKIPAFKEITMTLIEYQKFCKGRIACIDGNEFSPYWNDGPGALAHRTEIANSLDANYIFLQKSSRNKIQFLLNEMSFLCNAEAQSILDPEKEAAQSEYERQLDLVEDCIEVLFEELNIK